MKRIRVAVVDDHAIVRVGLKCTIQAFKELEFAGAHADGEGAADFVAAVRSDITLLDIRMPHKDGVAALGEILARDPSAKVIMLTTAGTEEDVYRSLELGAKGYVLKDGDTENIIEAIRTVAAGGTYVPEEIRRIYESRCGRESLTERESLALRLLADGRTNREIAAAMGISEDGVKGHLRHINEKFGTKDRVEAVAVAIRRGIIRAVLM